jgi:hypothetical protein
MGVVMRYRSLGSTGVKVSPLCLGAMMFGAMGNTDHDDCVAVIHRALDAGINFIDTADVYSGGESEEIGGKALASRVTIDADAARRFQRAILDSTGGAQSVTAPQSAATTTPDTGEVSPPAETPASGAITFPMEDAAPGTEPPK